MRTFLSIARIFVLPVVGAVAIALAIRENCFRFFAIPSESMAPTLLTGDHFAAVPYDSLFWSAEPERGDVVVFRRDGSFYVKRILAAPGDVVEISGDRVRVNGVTLAEPYVADATANSGQALALIPGAEYFVVGDNRQDSVDSRAWGTLPRAAIWGRARIIFWSDGDASSLNEPAIAEPARTRDRTLPTVRWQRIGRVIE